MIVSIVRSNNEADLGVIKLCETKYTVDYASKRAENCIVINGVKGPVSPEQLSDILKNRN